MNLFPRVDHLTLADSDSDLYPPHLTALLEARGALLRWRIDRDESLPDALIHDPSAALEWLPDVYGPNVVDAVLHRVSTTGRAAETDTGRAARLLAHLDWSAAWWPAGRNVPALSTELIAAEAAVLTSSVEHLLDDPDAVENALLAARHTLSAVTTLAPALAAAIRDLADDNGIELASVAIAESVRADWALAAGSAPGGSAIDVAAGSADVAWSGFPAQTVAADGAASWALVQRGGALTLRVTAPAVAPGAEPVARFGPDGLVVPLTYTGQAYTGEVPGTVELLRLRDAERTLRVHDPRMAGEAPTPEPAAERAAVLAFAAARLSDPWSLAERDAAR